MGKNRYRILPNVGENVEIEGTRVDFDSTTNRISVFDGDDLVASIPGGGFHLISDEA